MGLIDFIKNAGEKLFGTDEPSAEEIASKREAENSRISDSLLKAVRMNGIPIKDLEVRYNGGIATIKGQTESQSDAEKAVLVIGNVKGVGRVDDQIKVLTPEPQAVFYTVKSGDSLSKIAKTQYGDAMKYPVIFEANKPMLKDPDKIYPGQVLRIPPLNGAS
ncbi:MAG: peptidoglycan-binding protein LysM [Cyclobacteriaceae bacterium]|nr:MAG: peptidoglycan-binding protein LysM [Cyclobacteriaceae bacterium]